MNMQKIRPHLPWITLVVLVAIVGAANPGFLRPANLLEMAGDIVPLFVMALGMTFVVYIGGIDLSAGSVVGATAMIAVAAHSAAMMAACASSSGFIEPARRGAPPPVSLPVLAISRFCQLSPKSSLSRL